MDVLAGLLDGPRARGAFLLRAIMEPPWSLRIQDEAPLTLVAVVTGAAWVLPDHGGPVHLGAGAVALIRGPEPYTMADEPDTPPLAVIHPGQRCETPDGRPLEETMSLGVRTWGNDPDGGTVLLVGTYETCNGIGRRLLAALPPLISLPAGSWSCPLVDLLGVEIVRDEPGQAAVLDRLLDLVLISVLRDSLAQAGSSAPPWYDAHGDPAVGRALRLLQNHPAETWTVATLAAAVDVSRATLARRFTEIVGEPPMTYLAGWRLTLAADLLLEPGATVGSVARQVGYGSAFAFSTAFKRAHGVSPLRHRRDRLDAERAVAARAGAAHAVG